MKWFSSSWCYAFAADGAIAIKRHLVDAFDFGFGFDFGWDDGPVSESVLADSNSKSIPGVGCFRVGSCKLWWGD